MIEVLELSDKPLMARALMEKGRATIMVAGFPHRPS
jgi:hypothetical protein